MTDGYYIEMKAKFLREATNANNPQCGAYAIAIALLEIDNDLDRMVTTVESLAASVEMITHAMSD